MFGTNGATSPEMSGLEYEVWREFIQHRCGLYFTENRLRFLRQRLWERMRAREIRSYSEYYHHVAFNPGGDEEWQELLELLLNQETGFFRHQPSFDALVEHVLPRLMYDKQRHGINGITMWSAGCSVGQEPYSLAMAFLEMVEPTLPRRTGEAIPLSPVQSGGMGGWQVKVSGSDISRRGLDLARRAQYKHYQVRTMPDHYRQKYMSEVVTKWGLLHQVNDRVRALVQFGYTNLNEPTSYWISAQDVIFCQNVLIYFEPENRVEIVRRLCQRLNVGGYLFLAPAEVVGLKLPGIEPVRLTDVLVYQRRA
jgi:chemotaxis methyl-accepting protein methylase